MSRIGLLTYNGGISRLSGTRLMMGAVNSGGFGRATNFLQQTRQLFDNEIISVEGTDDSFGQMPVIVITDANRVGFAIMAVTVPQGGGPVAQKAGAKGGRAKKAGAAKGGAKKGGKAGAERGGAGKAASKRARKASEEK